MADRIWVVYGLIDPKTGWVFYIGITQNLERRVSDHQQQKSSAAWEMCQEIAQSGGAVRYCVFGQFAEKELAERLERHLIIAVPQTFNKTFLSDGCKFWEPLALKYGYRQQA